MLWGFNFLFLDVRCSKKSTLISLAVFDWKGCQMKKILLAVLIVLSVAAGIAWINRMDLMLALVQFQASRAYEVVPNRPVRWQQGPGQADLSALERPPNVIVI
ncbi:MAG: hypothetical protein ACI89D_001711 [Bermanella sp.]